MKSSRILVAFALVFTACSVRADEPQWKHLSSAMGDLPVPGPSTEQTGALVADLDKDGTNDFVISFRKTAPALVWYRRCVSGWERYVIDTNFLTVEAGGAVNDIDGDGNPDILDKPYTWEAPRIDVWLLVSPLAK